MRNKMDCIIHGFATYTRTTEEPARKEKNRSKKGGRSGCSALLLVLKVHVHYTHSKRHKQWFKCGSPL